MAALRLTNYQMVCMSSNIRFIDSNIFIYAILKPKRAINEKVTKMKEKSQGSFIEDL
ncbi:DNA-binding protein [Acidianus hospitalis]|uniref:DNA-binding protein n=1 Tax=Acidianus hospitalis TaxID=563177 RepID=A0A2T9X990_9CREN|nr:DNA-binding protein [Acidianus hospitalis]